jgi:hypothetical protein
MKYSKLSDSDVNFQVLEIVSNVPKLYYTKIFKNEIFNTHTKKKDRTKNIFTVDV